MPNYNKVLLMGNLTRDVEIKYVAGNQAVGTFAIASNRKYRTKDGEDREDVTFVDCEAWGRTAENIGKFFSKGRPIFIEGRLKLDQWQDKDGNKRSKLLVVVESFEFLNSGNRGEGGASESRSGGSQRDTTNHPSHAEHGSTPAGVTHEAVGEEDIPF